MKTMKTISGVAAAVAMLGLSAIAQAEECTKLADDIEEVAFDYGCYFGEYNLLVENYYPDGSSRAGEWNYAPIWQWKGGKNGDGCKVHLGLISQLYVPHGSPPKGQGNGKGYRDAKGAANALRDGKPEDAYYHLQNVIDTIDNAAKLNEDLEVEVYFGGNLVTVRADYFEGRLRQFAVDTQELIYDPDTEEVLCSVQ